MFNRKYPLQRVLKKRFFKVNKLPQLKYGTIGLYCASTFRFEYKYGLFFRKFFKKLFKNRKKKINTTIRRKTWLFIRPNYVLTHKSKNARMGKGKGNFKRWCTVVYPGHVFIEHTNVSYYLYKRYRLKIRLKLKTPFKICSKQLWQVKYESLNNSFVEPTDLVMCIRLRRQLRQNLKYF